MQVSRPPIKYYNIRPFEKWTHDFLPQLFITRINVIVRKMKSFKFTVINKMSNETQYNNRKLELNLPTITIFNIQYKILNQKENLNRKKILVCRSTLYCDKLKKERVNSSDNENHCDV